MPAAARGHDRTTGTPRIIPWAGACAASAWNSKQRELKVSGTILGLPAILALLFLKSDDTIFFSIPDINRRTDI
jgi:hypothetical protein